ncbi:MAG: translation elongation factor Ts [Chloroflexi bacterium]|nr:translation elongation factor Ts [Chloroflexota bacterium]
MAVTTDMIRELRDETGAGVLDCKRALEETGGDIAAATELLRRQGLAAAAKKTERVASDGRIEPYVHPGNRLAALVEVNCETDFVARTEEFIALTHELAMQVAAAKPRWVSRDDVPAEVLEAEKASYIEEMAGQNKPPQVMERIIEGKLGKFYAENCLLEQEYIRDSEQTIQDLITAAIAKLGENVVVRRFCRFQIGAED